MHTIRLREPWIVELQSGRVIYRRYFNRPTGLQPGDIVQLAIDGLRHDALVSFNGHPLPASDAMSWEIGGRLQPRNIVIVEAAGSEGLPFREVRLEIGTV
jgi:hypothetical protein